ncbi:ENR1 protein, partial [Buphagus erythrorhynchus]|nr:ENR1 protein [Buphagus erythrorhynchus]
HEGHGLHECADKGRNPFRGIREISKYWEFPTQMGDFWEAPEHLFWICGKQAYTKLPGKWSGSCTVRIIKLAFLLPKDFGSKLGVPL